MSSVDYAKGLEKQYLDAVESALLLSVTEGLTYSE
jgi:hypothetical protein